MTATQHTTQPTTDRCIDDRDHLEASPSAGYRTVYSVMEVVA